MNIDGMKGEVQTTVGVLKGALGQLTDNARLAREGCRQKLAGMIRARAAISREGARRQVQTFYSSFKS